MNRKRLFYDIETSPNIAVVWRAGYKLQVSPESIIKERAIICISYKWEGGNVKTLTWDKNQCDKKMLTKFVKIINKADEIVAHNGDKFDVKWIKGRCLFHRIPIPTSFVTVDTCTQARKHFLFNSNKLDYLGQFLKVGKKHETGGFGLWMDILLNRDQAALDKMVAYCEQDVLLLERVYNEMKGYIDVKFNYAVKNGDGKYCCPECGSSNVKVNKTTTTAMGTIRRQMWCYKECGRFYTVSNKVYMDLLQFRMKYQNK